MKILVTGGAGFIGSHIVDQCIAAGHQVTVVDNLWEEGGGKNTNLNPQARFFRVDITNEDSLNKIFDSVQPEVVCHQAAQHSVAVSTKNPKLDARVNVLGLLNILTNCSRLGVRKIIFASSGATYGTPARLPLDEEVEQRPESPYGITKMVAEHYLRYWKEAYGLAYTALRYGNVYGPRQDPNGEAGVIAIFAKRFLNHEAIRIDWDGEQQKDYVFFQAEDGIRDYKVTGVQTCALPIYVDIRRRRDRVGRDRVPAQHSRVQDDLRDPLSRAHATHGGARSRAQLQRGCARSGGRNRVPASARAGRPPPVLRHPCGAACAASRSGRGAGLAGTS